MVNIVYWDYRGTILGLSWEYGGTMRGMGKKRRFGREMKKKGGWGGGLFDEKNEGYKGMFLEDFSWGEGRKN